MPIEGNVLETEVVLFAPEARVAIVVGVIPETAPPPFEAVATWKKLEKLAPVEAVPVLLMVEERIVETPTVAVVGVTNPAVRSGAAQVLLLIGVDTPFTVN